ncbi:MAG: molybdopterin-dependent oxidoreductase, partial [Polyangiales bacterium]
MTQEHFVTCSLCEAMCGLRVTTNRDRVEEIRGDEADPLSRGHLCPKAVALKDLHEDPNRLRQPMRRVGDAWKEVTWDEALEEVATRIHDTQSKYGRNAVGMYIGNPTVHNTGAVMFAPALLSALRSRNRFSATSCDQLPHMLASYWMFGHQALFAVPDIDRTDCMLIIGGNPLVSNGSLMSAPGVEKRLESIKARGGRVIVLDPRRTETARIATEHHFVRPGRDVFFLIGLLQRLLEKGPRLRQLETRIKHLDTLRNAVFSVPLSRCAELSGVSAETIDAIATAFYNAKSAVCYGRLGAHTQEFGGLNAWLIHAINIVSGNLDRPGGAMFPTPAIDLTKEIAGMGLGAGSYGRWTSRVRGLPEFGGEL